MPPGTRNTRIRRSRRQSASAFAKRLKSVQCSRKPAEFSGRFRWIQTHDGRTGEPFDNLVTGRLYVLPLSCNHLVDDKIHATALRSLFQLSRPPAVKAQFGGQRFEKWKLGA